MAATESQGWLFLGFHVIYILCEIFFIWQTILVFKREQPTCDSWELVAFYASMHLVFIRTSLFLLGGFVFCYPKEFYLFLDTYCFVFKRFALFMLVYRMAKILRQMDDTGRSFSERLVLIICVVDAVLFTGVYCLYRKDVVIYSYIFAMELLLTTLFILFAKRISSAMHKVSPYDSQTFQWNVFIIIMGVSFLMRAVQATFNQMSLSDKLKTNFEFAVYHVLYLVITEITPCMLMIWIIFSSTKDSSQHDESLFSSQASS